MSGNAITAITAKKNAAVVGAAEKFNFSWPSTGYGVLAWATPAQARKVILLLTGLHELTQDFPQLPTVKHLLVFFPKQYEVQECLAFEWGGQNSLHAEVLRPIRE